MEYCIKQDPAYGRIYWMTDGKTDGVTNGGSSEGCQSVMTVGAVALVMAVAATAVVLKKKED